MLERGDEFGLGGVAFEDGERLEELDLADGLGGAAVRAEAADEALGNDELDGGGDEEGLDAHIHEARDGAGCVVGVERGENQVAGKRGADRDLGGVFVADFADHDDVGVLAEDGTEGAGEGEADLGADLHLVYAGDFVFDGVFDGDDPKIGGIDFPEKRVKRGALAGARGAGDEDDAVRVVEDADDLSLLVGAHPEAVHRVGFLLLIQEAEGDGLGVDGRRGGDADIEDGGVGLEVDAAVLRETFFGDVEARHDLEARDNGVLEAEEVLRDGHGDEQAVDAVADAELFLLRLKVDVGGLVFDGLFDDVGDEADDRGVFVDDLLGLLNGLGGDVGFIAVVEGAGADAEVFDDELVNALGDGEVPDEGARGERAQPVGHRGIGQPGGGEVERLRVES